MAPITPLSNDHAHRTRSRRIRRSRRVPHGGTSTHFRPARRSLPASLRPATLADAVAARAAAIAPACAVGVALAVLQGGERAVQAGLIGGLVALCCTPAVRRDRPWADALGVVGWVVPTVAPATFAALPIAALLVLGEIGPLSASSLVLVWAVGAIVPLAPAAFLRRRRSERRPVRVAVVGPVTAADRLQRELQVTGSVAYEVVGRIAEEQRHPLDLLLEPGLGSLDALEEIIVSHRIEIVLVAERESRLRAYDQLAGSCLHLGVRAAGVEEFCEHVFGHVPVHDIDASWFEHMLSLDRRPDPIRLRRLLDVVGSIVLGVTLLPLLAVAAVLIRLDGGPVLFRQIRVGEGGRSFTMYKLRTMRQELPAEARWTEPDDPRLTRIGRLLRRTHIDEAPQFLNILRGEMSIVGPRPEQPELATRLETLLPFYQRRHLIRPGLTGWAQIRCGYAGSEEGSFWKLCHDLYYVRYRSLLFDVAIVIETVHTLLRNIPARSAARAED